MSGQLPIDDEALIRLRHAPDGADQLASLRQQDAVAADRLSEWDQQDDALRTLYQPVADEPVPDRFRTALLAGAEVRRRDWPVVFRIAATVVLLLLGATGGWLLARWDQTAEVAQVLPDEALQAHSIYSVEVIHPVEVPATDEIHLVAWLSKRLGHAITPPDLDVEGFRLLGGRVVPDVNGAAALLMYENAGGIRISLFIALRPGSGETALRFTKGDSSNGFWWIDDGLGCVVVGAVDRHELNKVAVAAYQQLVPA